MNNTMEYKGYIGSIEFSETDNVFFGKILGIRSLITYEGSNGIQLVKDFHDAIDEYLNECKRKAPCLKLPTRGALIYVSAGTFTEEPLYMQFQIIKALTAL